MLKNPGIPNLLPMTPEAFKQLGFILLAFTALGCLLAGFYYGEDILQNLNTQAIEDFLKRSRSSLWAPVIVWGTYVAAGLTFFPVTVVSLAVAGVFGFTAGILYGLSGALLSASLLFWIGQKIGADRLQRWMPRRIEKVNRKLGKSGVSGVATLRLVVFAPYSLFNLVMGISAVKYRDFLIGSALGMLPGFVVRGMIGDSFIHILLNPTWLNMAYLTGGLLLWVAILLGAQKLIDLWQKKASR